MNSGFSFNKLWVIESLKEQDRKTGKNLYENKLMYLDIIIAWTSIFKFIN